MKQMILKTMALAVVIAAGQTVATAAPGGTSSGPTQTVIVNTDAQPVPVKVAGAPTPEPFAFKLSMAPTLQAQNSPSFVVPVSKRYVVEQVSAACYTTSLNMKIRMALIGIGPVNTTHILRTEASTFPAGQFIEVSQPMKMYLNPGDAVHFWMYRSETTSTSCDFHVSGYQVNAQ